MSWPDNPHAHAHTQGYFGDILNFSCGVLVGFVCVTYTSFDVVLYFCFGVFV